MVRTLVVALVLGVCAAAAAAPPVRRVVVILPPGGDAEAADLALALQTRAAAVLARAGGFEEVHLKQILRVAERDGLSRATLATPGGAAVVARRFGAERAIYSTLARSGDGWLLAAAAAPDAHAAGLSVKLSGEAARAYHDGALALARFAAGPGVKIEAGRPATASSPALAAYAHGYAILVTQPLLVDTPMVLDDAQLAQAVASCRAAVAADPQFLESRAALGLALALAGKDAEAVETLARIKADDDHLPLYWLARYWLVTRYQSADAGATALRTAIERHPYFLLARGFLAQHESALHHDAAALEAWRAYQAELPHSAFVRGGISHSLARLGRTDEAIAEARAAAADARDDQEAQLELASRYIDAGHDADAVRLLAPLAAAPGARAELLLRLGFAYARMGDVANAEKWLTQAEGAASRPSDWRTRARARLDRGVLLIKAGRVDEGQAILVSAERGGLRRYMEAQKDADLQRMIKDAESAQRDKKVHGFEIRVPAETSPFTLDGAGEIAPASRPPPAPRMFEVLRF